MRQSNSVRFAILGLIGTNPEGVHGYALRRQCADALGHLWQLTLQEVYRVLSSLSAEGWITANGRDPIAGRKVYCITPLGQQSLDEFLLSPARDVPQLRRQEIAAKLLFARPERLPELIDVISAKRDVYVQQLAVLAVQRRKLRRLPVDPFFANLLIDGSEISVRAEIEWLNHVCEKLAERFGAPAV